MSLFSSNAKSYLGIDIGTSSIKIVELKKNSGKLELVNYAFTENKLVDSKREKSSEYIHSLIKKTYQEADFISNRAIVSLPTSEVFSSVVTLSGVNKDNLSDAIKSESEKIMPMSLDDVALDWKIIEEDKKTNNIKVFITGSPKTTIKKYIDVFKNFDINLMSLETEIFSLIRSFSMSKSVSQMIVEIGMSSTDISIIKNDIPILNRSVKIGGNLITKAISESLDMKMSRAEKLKQDLGMLNLKNDGDILPVLMIDVIDPIINEIKYIMNLFQNKYFENVDSIVLAGGAVLLSNLVLYMSKKLNINVSIGDPWYDVNYKKELKPVLYEIGPKMAVAVGLAKRELV